MARYAALLWPQGTPIIKTKKTLRTKPYTERRERETEREREREERERERELCSENVDTHGRLRARCGSNAQQNCVPATALSS